MKRGFFVGAFLTVRRILRCNPFCEGGYDPVPLKKAKKIPKYDKDRARDTSDEDTSHNDGVKNT